MFYCGSVQAEMAVSFNEDMCFRVEVLMKHFRLQIHKKNNNESLFLYSLYTRPHLFSRAHYASCHSNQIKLMIHNCIMNKHKACDGKIHVLTNTTLCFSSFTQKNNEPAYRAGNFTDLIQSQVSALCIFLQNNCKYIYLLFQPSQDIFILCIFSRMIFVMFIGIISY